RDGGLEVLERFEAAVDAGEAQVGDFVELAQRLEDREADLVARHLGDAARADLVLHGLRQFRHVVGVDRPPLAGLHDAVGDLVATEGLGGPAALDHGENGLLDGGEPLLALLADATAADDLAVLGLAGVDHSTVGMTTVRASHRYSPPWRSSRPARRGRCSGAAVVQSAQRRCDRPTNPNT